MLALADEVNSPAHYKAENFECIDVIKHVLSHEEFAGYCKGNVIKYMYRHNYKGNTEQDLQKAYWYLSKVLNVALHFDVDNTPTSEKSGSAQNAAPDCPACGQPCVKKIDDGTFLADKGQCECAECTWIRNYDGPCAVCGNGSCTCGI